MGGIDPTKASGRTSISPWLSVDDVAEALDFYRAAFGARELYRLEDDDSGRIVVAQLAIDGAEFWVQESAEPAQTGKGGGPVRMIVTVDDPDPLFERALAAGGVEVSGMSEDFGGRIGRLADPFGLHWEIGKQLSGENG
jgi:PhnB protein